ncbi:MAG: hypothetical protein M3065_10350 [Actinomycetota bacterium]|nr:hypothetical protein [Actinomycetota bacterium]
MPFDESAHAGEANAADQEAEVEVEPKATAGGAPDDDSADPDETRHRTGGS